MAVKREKGHYWLRGCFLRFLLIFSFSHQPVSMEEVVCGGFDLRSSPTIHKYIDASNAQHWVKREYCTVIEGNAHYFIMTSKHGQPYNHTDFKHIAYPKVREITGNLIIYQIEGLETLNILLPSLRIIRGNSLFSNYAFIVFQNAELKEIGLYNLTEISRGGVRIAGNNMLCYASTVDWKEISVDKNAHIYVHDNQHPDSCGDHCKNCVQNKPNQMVTINCWNYDTCQLTCPSYCKANGTTCNMETSPHTCCHEECATGCTGPTERDCYVCRHVLVDGVCQKACPESLYKVVNRKCITETECRNRPLPTELNDKRISLRHKPLENGICATECPPGYAPDSLDSSKCIECTNDTQCQKHCSGSQITSLGEAMKLKGCKIITDSLVINIQTGLSMNIVKELEDYLGEIREVRDFVKISFTPSLVTLSILKNLRVIHGNNLLNQRYALSVFENQNLAQLVNITDGLRIANGTVQFHNNPRLCYSTIRQFTDTLNLQKIDDSDVSQNSNGNKAICEEQKFTINITGVTDITIVMVWEEFDTENKMDNRMFLGYQLYYKEAESMNVNIFDGRDACNDSWTMSFLEPGQRGTMLDNLKPNTLYAIYVATLMVYSPGAKGGVSNVVYAKTRFNRPDRPIVIRIESPTADSILLQWDPPHNPNGDITHYMIVYVPKFDRPSMDRNYCDDRKATTYNNYCIP